MQVVMLVVTILMVLGSIPIGAGTMVLLFLVHFLVALNRDIKSGSAHKIPNPEFHYSDRSHPTYPCSYTPRLHKSTLTVINGQGLKTMKLQSKSLRFDPDCAQIL